MGKENTLVEIEGRRNQTIKMLRDLIKYPTVVPPGDKYEEICDFLIPKFEGLGFEAEKIIMPDDIFEKRQREKNPSLKGKRVNLHAFLKTEAKETVIVSTHLDVVPPGSGWDVPPFEGVVKDSRIYGRGASDSKSGIAALLTALSAIEEKGIELKYNVRVVLVTDEEVGPYSGLCYFADEGILEGDYFLSMDGSGDAITIGTNGVINWCIEVYGRSWHSGSSFLGVNPIEKAKVIMEEFINLKSVLEKRKSRLPSTPAIRDKVDLKNVIPVLNITMINAGIKENIIPDKCILKGDRRYIPEERIEDVVSEIEEALKRSRERDPDLEFRWTYEELYPPMYTDPNHPWTKKVQRIASHVRGEELELVGAQGSLDVAYAIQKAGIPVCCYGVGRLLESKDHAANENVRIDDLMNYAKFLGVLLTT
ncbi:MAG: M20 family metallopeptidase [Candidatus Hydrothermarchaeota archaeon]